MADRKVKSTAAHRFNRRVLVLGGLWLSIMISGLAVVWSTHMSRQLFNELETQRGTASELQVERGQYLLEQSTWAAYSRVERIAEEELQMQSPESEQIVVLRP